MTTREFLALVRNPVASMTHAELTDKLTTITRTIERLNLASLAGNLLTIKRTLLGRVAVRDCHLGRLELDGFELREMELANSQIGDLRMRTDAGLLLIKSRIVDCHLDTVTAKHMLATDSQFHGVTVSEIKRCDRAQVKRCTFDGCSISGRLSKCNFIDCTFRDTDMSGVSFTDTSFMGCTGLPVVPNRPDNFLMEPARFSEILPDIRGRVSTVAEQTYTEMAQILAKASGSAMIDIGFFDNMPVDDAKIVMERLYAKRMHQ